MRRRRLLVAGLLAPFAVACSAVLGVDDFSIRPSTSTAADAADTADAADAAVVTDTSAPITDSQAPITETGPPGECKVNADCAGRGEFWICRKSDQACVSLQSQDCSKILGDFRDDNAVILGSVLPTSGPDLTSGVPIENAIGLAIRDFRDVSYLPPKPGSTARRPLALVGCTDASDDAVAVRAAKHLVQGLQVPAIIGAAFSGITIKVATDVTIPAGTLLVSPSATSVAITGLQDNGLVWRTSPSDVIQAEAAVKLFPEIEADIVSGFPDGGARPLKVAIAHKGDAYGRGLADAVSATLTFNGKSALSQINSGTPTAGDFASFDYGDETPAYNDVVTKVTTQRPDVVFLFGTTETLTEVMRGIEVAWPTSGDAPPRPRYVLADGSLVAEAATVANGTPPSPDAAGGGLRRRIIGTVPGTTNTNFVKFQNLYNSRISDGTSPSTGGAANAYDALYGIAFAIVAAGDAPLTGAAIRDGFARQVVKGGGVIDVGSAANINNAFQKLTAGQGFDFNGASGPLDYDLVTGEASSDIQLWCLPLEGGVAGSGRATSVFFNAQKSALEDTTGALGTYAKVKSDCDF